MPSRHFKTEGGGRVARPAQSFLTGATAAAIPQKNFAFPAKQAFVKLSMPLEQTQWMAIFRNRTQ